MVDPDQADEMDAVIERYGEVQARFEELDGYALEGRAREVLAGLSFSQEMMDGDVGKCCRAAGRCAWRWPASC
jgi:ATPase subunit of ABC transporter with duplicated ATPase domains